MSFFLIPERAGVRGRLQPLGKIGDGNMSEKKRDMPREGTTGELGAGSPADTQPLYVVWCGRFQTRTRDPIKTLSKVKDRADDYQVWLYDPKLGGYIFLDKEGIEKLLRGEDVETYYVLEPPYFRGCKARGAITINKSELE